MITRRTLLSAAPMGLLARLASARPSPAADRVLAAVDDAADLRLLQEMIRMRSYSAGGEESALAKKLVGDMRALGLEARLQEVEPGRYNAIGTLKGTGGGKSLMLNGHIDTNPVGVGWTVDPFAGLVRDGFVHGIGVSNMKASDAAFFGAARAVVRSGVRLRGDLVLAFVVGELQGGVGTKKLVADGVRTDHFIVGEPTDLALMTLHAANVEFAVHTFGITRHMSKAEEAVSAIDTMYLVIERLKRMTFSGPSNPDYASVRRLNIGSMRAGLGREYFDWRTPQVPDVATIKVAVRYGPGQTGEGVLADVQRELDRLSREHPEVKAEIAPPAASNTNRTDAFEVAKDAPFVQLVRRAHQRVMKRDPEVGAVAPYRYYGTDAPFLAAAGAEGLVCGVGGKYNTMPDEKVELTDFHGGTRLYALVAAEVCG
ncbi:MAG: M20 family metallopeptidase [Vicinamibacterales bacterium]